MATKNKFLKEGNLNKKEVETFMRRRNRRILYSLVGFIGYSIATR